MRSTESIVPAANDDWLEVYCINREAILPCDSLRAGILGETMGSGFACLASEAFVQKIAEGTDRVPRYAKVLCTTHRELQSYGVVSVMMGKICKRALTFAASLVGLGVFTVAVAAQPAAPATQGQQPDYLLHAGDQIEISVWREEDMQRTVIVRPDGKFTFPLTGEVVAAGRTVAQIRSDIEQRLQQYIPEPVVTVSVTGIEGNRIYVIGQVNKPGSYVMNPGLSVMQVLSLAGGTTPYAALNDIIVIRGSGARQQTLNFRYADVSRGRGLEQNIQLESGDVVVVP